MQNNLTYSVLSCRCFWILHSVGLLKWKELKRWSNRKLSHVLHTLCLFWLVWNARCIIIFILLLLNSLYLTHSVCFVGWMQTAFLWMCTLKPTTEFSNQYSWCLMFIYFLLFFSFFYFIFPERRGNWKNKYKWKRYIIKYYGLEDFILTWLKLTQERGNKWKLIFGMWKKC